MDSKKKNEIKKILADEEGLELAFLFGSEARGHARASSDVDIAIFMNQLPSAERRLELRIGLSGKLGDLMGREVEVVILNSAGSILKYQVAKDGELLFERKMGGGKVFRLNAIKEYFDFLPTFNFHYKRLAEGVC